MKTVMGTVLLMVLVSGCAQHADYAVSALVRGDEARVMKIDLAEILTP